MKAVKALQEAMAKIETLETKVAALESHSHDAPAAGSDARLEAVVAKLKATEPGKWKEL